MKYMFLWSVSLLCAFSGCMTAPLFKESSYNAIAVGSDIEGVVAIYGEPYEIQELPNGVQEYHYLQRIPCGAKRVEQVDYVFLVRHGKIVSKKCMESNNVSGLQFSN